MEPRDKFILTDESGRFQVRSHPDNAILFSNCLNEYFCDGGEMFAGAFMREHIARGRMPFTVFWMAGDKSSDYANVAKGFCSEI